MLANYIQDLLYRYECVIVPEFGGFIIKNVSAKIDDKSNAFTPPSLELSFDSQLTENDNILSNYIASVDNMSQESALNFINFVVDEWKEKLSKQDLELKNIGTFSLNAVGKIVFEPNKNSDLIAHSFGMSNIEIKEKVRSESDIQNITDMDESAPKYVKRKRKPEPGRKKWKNYLIYTIIFAFVLGLGFVIGKQILQNNEYLEKSKEMQESQDILLQNHLKEVTIEIKNPLKAVTLKVTQNATFDSLIPNEKLIDTSKVQAQIKIKPIESPKIAETEIKPETKKEVVTPIIKNEDNQPAKTSPRTDNGSINTDGKAYIIAGSFRDSGNAIAKVKELKSKGYNAIIIDKNSAITQVSYGLYANEQEAEAALKKINIEDPEAWIKYK